VPLCYFKNQQSTIGNLQSEAEFFPPPPNPTRVIVVRAGATLSSPIDSDLIHVETGGVYQAATGSDVRLMPK
jgi:hypothetical protein